MGWKDVVDKGYDAFAAEKGRVNDGNQDCVAYIAYRDSDIATTKWIVGSTGKGAGHAEMHALTQFVTNECDGKVSKFKEYAKYGIEVMCEAKPCCLYCSAILGMLRIKPWDHCTTKSDKRMGSTQWAINMSLRTFMSEYTGIPVQTFTDIDSY
jgi:tRNA(Arg) A34 adenosine deaminase TadA